MYTFNFEILFTFTVHFVVNNEDYHRPTLVTALTGIHVTDVALGTRDSQTLVVSDRGMFLFNLFKLINAHPL